MNICAALLIVILSFWSSAPVFEQEGTASFYADRLHGHRTTSGERYNRKALTAAHATLPFNTLVTVTNLQNKRTVTVRINDRIPARTHKVLDLSKAAAIKLGMISKGLGKVKLTVNVLPKGKMLPQPDTLLAGQEPAFSG